MLLWDNAGLAEHTELIRRHPHVRVVGPHGSEGEMRHAQSLDRLRLAVDPGTEFIITLDTDSFPVRDGWIENLTGRLDHDTLLAGVWRDEMLPAKPAFIHPCGLASRHETLDRLGTGFAIRDGVDVGARVTEDVLESGKRVSRLARSNRWNPHFIMGALYGDLIYHQGAGSRLPRFARDSDPEHDERIRQSLRDTAFARLDDLVAVLAGDESPEMLSELAWLVPSVPDG